MTAFKIFMKMALSISKILLLRKSHQSSLISVNSDRMHRELHMARGYEELVKRMPSVKKVLDSGSSESLKEFYKQVSGCNGS